MRFPAMALLACLALSVLLPGQLEAVPPEEIDPFEDEITVSLVTLTVRAVDAQGRPILGLGPEDFRVRVGRREVPVAAVDWYGAGSAAPGTPAPELGTERRAEPATEPTGGPGLEGDRVFSPPGKLVVFFVQADLNPTRISGQLRLRPYTAELLDTLDPEDRMAVVSFDSHLHLRQDFTRDREAVYAAIDRGMLYGRSETGPGDGEVALAGSFDPAAAFDAASPERGLEVMAEALEALPGEKVIVYLGWGLGRFGSFGVTMTPAFAPAVRALRRAKASVFVLDVTSADYHSLEVGLEAVAAETGGTYAKTHVLTGLATDFLAQAISGHYVLTLDAEALTLERGEVTVDLQGRKGTVLHRPVRVR
jgi:VWFA-related protein